MANDDVTVNRVRRVLSNRSDVIEKAIVGGGLGFMVDGHLCCGVSVRGLTVRVGPDAKSEALAMPHVGPLTLGDREAAAFVVVEPAGLRDEDTLEYWVHRGLRFVDTLS